MTTPTPNPLLTDRTLPYQLPPFDQIEEGHFREALEEGMSRHLAEIGSIVASTHAPTLENTVLAMERAGQVLAHVARVFFALTSTDATEELDALEAAFAPRLAAHRDKIWLNETLFDRVRTVYESRHGRDLDEETLRLVEEYYADFVQAGAALSEAGKQRLKAINAELATLETTFGQHVLEEVNASGIVVDSRDELAGLTEAQIATAAEAATARHLNGKYIVGLHNTSSQPLLVSLDNRAMRHRVMAASLARGLRGGDFDTRAAVTQLARLRAERAQLLGYPTHADFVLERATARTVDAVRDRLNGLIPPAVENARREAAALQAVIDDHGDDFPLAAWDWAYYAEKVRASRFDLDQAQLRPYFELNRVLTNGVFFSATRLYGLTFSERPDLPVYHPDVRVFEVFDADGSPLGLFITDFYARPTKRGGAWMNDFVSQSRLLDDRPVVANYMNLQKPPAGDATLLSLDEVETLFHEFGHALHGLLSDVQYPYFSGTSVPRDFVEYPSQINEMWATWPEVLQHYAAHHETGHPMPAALLDKVREMTTFNQGHATTEYLAAACLDLAWHVLTPDEIPTANDLVAFEAAALQAAGVSVDVIPPRYRSTYFVHIFSNNYSAGYYSYIWSEVLDADTVEWFREHGGLTRENGDRFRRMVLSKGGSVDAMTLYVAFRGRAPDVTPLLRRRGLDRVQ